jgi:hypothetical protein
MTTELMALDRVRRRQHGILTRAQLWRAGVTEGQVRADLEARRWRALNEVVICTHNGPLTTPQAQWATVLSAAAPAALAGLTAMQGWGVSGFAADPIHVLVARGARVTAVPGIPITVHESRRFSVDDICTEQSPNATSLERSVVDAAVWSRDALTASRIIVAPIQQRKTSAGQLRETLENAGHVKYRRVLLALLSDLYGGAEALSEVSFLRWCRRHGFPRPVLQVRLDNAGRRRYVDAVFRGLHGRRVLVEVDGGVHLTLATRWQDTSKDNDAVIAGELTLRFPSVAIHSDDPAAVRQLREALGLVSVRRASGNAPR